MCRVVRWSLSASVYLILLCLSAWAVGDPETEAVCHASGKKVCVSVEQSVYEKWLWFSTECNSDCGFYHDSFVDQFFPIEHLADFNGFGFGFSLRNKTEGRMVLSHYQLGKQSKKQALAAAADKNETVSLKIMSRYSAFRLEPQSVDHIGTSGDHRLHFQRFVVSQNL